MVRDAGPEGGRGTSPAGCQDAAGPEGGRGARQKAPDAGKESVGCDGQGGIWHAAKDASGTRPRRRGKRRRKPRRRMGRIRQAKAAKEKAPRPSEREPIERRPYRISFHLACEPSARIDAARRAELLKQWQVLVKRFIGPPWAVTIEPIPGRWPVWTCDSRRRGLRGIRGIRQGLGRSHFRVPAVGPADYRTRVRYCLTPVRRLQQTHLDATSDAPRALLEFALDLFNPTAEITARKVERPS